MKKILLLLLSLVLLPGCTGNNEATLEDELNAVSIHDLLHRNHLQYLTDYVGDTPEDVSLWQTQPLSSRLPALLGPDYNLFLQCMATSSEISLQSDIILVQSQPVTKDLPQVVFKADVENDRLQVHLISENKTKTFTENISRNELTANIAKLTK